MTNDPKTYHLNNVEVWVLRWIGEDGGAWVCAVPEGEGYPGKPEWVEDWELKAGEGIDFIKLEIP